MKSMRAVEGVLPVLLTPFTEGGDLDEVGLERLLEFLLDKPIGGIWALGTGSEDMNLGYENRLRIARIVSRVNDGKVPLMMGASFFALEDTMRFIEDTATLDFDAYHMMPYHPLYSLERLEWHYRYIADRCPKPLWMYTSANSVR